MGKTPLYLAVKVSFGVAREEILKNIYLIRFIYSFRGQKTLGHANIGLL